MSVPPSRLRALRTARQCAQLGARQRTIAYLTGLPAGYILRAVYSPEHPAPKGRPSYNADFYFRSSARVRVAASQLALRYRALIRDGILPAQALIAAFRFIRSTFPTTTIAFDEAFFLVCNLDGIWAATTRTLDLLHCTECDRHYLASAGETHAPGSSSCPLCRAHWADSPGATAPPAAGAIHVQRQQLDLPVDDDIARVRLLQDLARLGASPKVAAVLTDSPRVALFRPRSIGPTVTAACLARPLPLQRWSTSLPVASRVQLAVFAAAYRKALEHDATAVQAVCAAVATMRSACCQLGKPISFDRCFEVAALLDGIWGVPSPGLQLATCGKCGSQYLQSRHESRAQPCPFCLLESRHHRLAPKTEFRPRSTLRGGHRPGISV